MRNPNATNGELMTILGEKWASMSENGQGPFLELANEEYKQYQQERALLEKAQKPNEMWQPIRRCRMVLDRLVQDGFANIFLKPVKLEDFPDYEDLIDHPMDLQTVRQKLDSKKYQMPEQFARDMRKIWNNCKIYNRHGSAIWHVADYMSKQFERLYHAWVQAFRERYLRWANPRARPWEHTCRQNDGKCNTKEGDLVVCDHCDAAYGIKCLKPPLEKLPTGIWHCSDCSKKFRSVRGVQMLSAMSEQAARKRAEYGEVPTRKVKRTMYLVKWSGLGYEHCTWETKDDIGNPELVAEYHKLNDSVPEEPCMSDEVAAKVLTETEHINRKNAGGSSCMPELRTRLYAQTRAFQFTKFGLDVPTNVCGECGPVTKASHEYSTAKNESGEDFKEILRCVNELTERVARQGTLPPVMKLDPSLPPLLTGEYDAVVPITGKGLMMNVGEIHGSVAFLGYRQFPDGTKGPSELKNLIRGPGDKIIAVDGVSTVKKSFKDVIGLLREAGKKKFSIIRFLESRYATIENDLTSYGNRGRYAFAELKQKFSTDRKRLLVQRSIDALNEKKEEEEKVEETKASDEEEDSEGEFQPDSDDEMEEDIGKAEKPMVLSEELKRLETDEDFQFVKEPEPKSPSKMETDEPDEMTDKINSESPEKRDKQDTVPSSEVEAKPNPSARDNMETSENPSGSLSDEKTRYPKMQFENTHSLAYRLLNIDVGYSSDEGGDEDGVFYIDGLDDTFTSDAEVRSKFNIVTPSKENEDENGEKTDDATKENLVPVRRNEFSALGDRSKLLASVAVTSSPPDLENFDENFPFPSKKSIEAKEAAKLAEAKKAEDEAITPGSPEKVKKSTVKVEQISPETSEVLNVWANVESAAATLQLPLNEIKRVLRGDLDEDFSDEVGGFRWSYAAVGTVVTAGESNRKGSKKGKEALNEFRDKLYDPSEPHKYKNNNRLRDYQVEGVNWLASTFYRKHGCILADEMGLGKVRKSKASYLHAVPIIQFYLTFISHFLFLSSTYADCSDCKLP
jgi:ribosomal protein L37AE/L43A